MNTPWQVIKTLENTSSRLEKEAILESAFRSLEDREFFDLLELCYDSLITFGVKQIPVKEDDNVLEGMELRVGTFRDLVQTLIDRTSTGYDARDLILELISMSSKDAWNNWFRRILLKDLKCGCDVKTINKVRGSLNLSTIKVFECQLAQDSSKHEDRMVGKKLTSVKLDGIRVLTVVYPEGKVQQFSRNGKELLNFDIIKEEIKDKICGLIHEPIVLDGEVMSKSFQDLMKQVYRKENVSTQDATLYLFDMIYLKDFTERYSEISQIARSNMLANLTNEGLNLKHVKTLEQILVDLDTVEGQISFKEINKKAVEAGFEGIMLKDIHAPYECKRTTSWLKLKPFIEVSLTIKGFEEGTGKNEGRLGALICEGVEDGKLIRVHVGGGFSDEQRTEFWDKRDNLLEYVIEVRADVITKNQDVKDESYSLRFPRFLRFRGFEKNEKI